MKKNYLLVITMIFSGMITAQTGNIGIGASVPASRLTVNGNMSVGSGYTGITAPADGSIIEGNVGIGTSAPTTKLDIIGTLKITDGSQGTGKVLTSAANGTASWQSPALTKATVTYINDGVVTLPAAPTGGAVMIQGNTTLTFPENGTYAVSFDYVGDMVTPPTASAWIETLLRDSAGSVYLNHLDYIPLNTNFAVSSATKYITITNAPTTLRLWLNHSCNKSFTLRPNSGHNYNDWFSYKVY